jgi:hypothetical protein
MWNKLLLKVTLSEGNLQNIKVSLKFTWTKVVTRFYSLQDRMKIGKLLDGPGLTEPYQYAG